MEENGETFIIDSKFKNPTNDRSAYSISVKNLTKSKKKKKKREKDTHVVYVRCSDKII